MASDEVDVSELTMDPGSLYREEVFTDRRAGTIRVLAPVKPDGGPDPSREVAYVGEAQMLTPAGVLPLAFEIEATSLREATEKFAAGAQAAAERMVKELQELRREAASSLIVPGRMPPDLRGGLGGLPGPGGLRGGGKLQLP